MKTKTERNLVQQSRMEAIISNAFTTTRLAWLQRLLDPRRDIDQECGHPAEILISDYIQSFERGDIASRVVRVFPEECWQDNPDIYETEDPGETEFERQWDELQDRLQLYAMLQRADILSGIGRFGVILLGFDGGQPLDQPVESAQSLAYVRTFDESLVMVKSVEQDPNSPRFGMPTAYDIQFSDLSVFGISGTGTQKMTIKTLTVHWTRIIHVCDNRTNSDVYGLPRMKVVYNRLLDLKKVAGGSGEMFWKGGFPGIALEMPVTKDVVIEYDKEATKEQLESYMNGLQRYLALIGMQAKSLAPQVADPGPHIEAQVRLIAMSMSIPWRVLMGVEVGQLASEQDMRSWNRRVGRRREMYVTPFIIRPFIERLISVGVLSKPAKLKVEWTDLNSPSDKDKAEVAEKMTNSIVKYAQGSGDLIVPLEQFLTLVLKFTDEEAKAILKEVDGMLEKERELDREMEEQSMAQKKALPAPAKPKKK